MDGSLLSSDFGWLLLLCSLFLILDLEGFDGSSFVSWICNNLQNTQKDYSRLISHTHTHTTYSYEHENIFVKDIRIQDVELNTVVYLNMQSF